MRAFVFFWHAPCTAARGVDRRILITRIVKAAGALLAGAVAVPMLALGASPALRGTRRPRWLRLGALDEFPVGRMTAAEVREPGREHAATAPLRAVFVLRGEADDVVVYSRSCTDLGCPLTFDRGSGWFLCPCHGGIFSHDGEPQAGPPNRPMYSFAVRIRDDVIEIDVNSVPIAA